MNVTSRLFVLALIILVACVPTVTPTPTLSPPITPTPFVSPITPTPPVSLIATPMIAAPQSVTSASVLVNGGMELPYYYPDIGVQMMLYEPNEIYGTIFAPHGWTIGWINPPPCQIGHAGCYIACPSNCVLPSGNCSNDSGCAWAMPETTRALAVEHEGLRVRTGDAAAKAFVVGRMGEWWYRQTVNLPFTFTFPITFSTHIQAWQCLDFSQCSKGQRSDKPTAMHLRVGIDPTGGTVVTSTNVVWSAEGDAHRIDKESPDIWRKFEVAAIPRGRRVTVFIATRVDWSLPAVDFPVLYDGNYSRFNGDVYLDDSELELPDYPLVFIPMVRR